MTSKRILAQHFGDGTHYNGHRRRAEFDYHCVANHDEDYSPKYMQGELCHDSMGEGLCNDLCNLCPRVCPVVPCPLPEDDA
jgi:hypothetical protein